MLIVDRPSINATQSSYAYLTEFGFVPYQFFYLKMLCPFRTQATLHGSLFFIICEWLFGKEVVVVSHWVLYAFEFTVVLLLDWLQAKSIEAKLPYYLTHISEEKWWSYAFHEGSEISLKYILNYIYFFIKTSVTCKKKLHF